MSSLATCKIVGISIPFASLERSAESGSNLKTRAIGDSLDVPAPKYHGGAAFGSTTSLGPDLYSPGAFLRSEKSTQCVLELLSCQSVLAPVLKCCVSAIG